MERVQDFSKIFTAFIVSLGESGFVLFIKIIFIVFSLFLAGFILFQLLKGSWLKFRFLFDIVEFLTYRPFGSKKIEKDWQKIILKLATGLESEYKLAIIEADNMLNQALLGMRYEGESLREKIEKVKGIKLEVVEEVKQAHKIRNNIVYDPNYNLSYEETKNCLDSFEKGFKELDVF